VFPKGPDCTITQKEISSLKQFFFSSRKRFDDLKNRVFKLIKDNKSILAKVQIPSELFMKSSFKIWKGKAHLEQFLGETISEALKAFGGKYGTSRSKNV